MKQITAVIPVRSGSKRCINKNIRPFGDTNLLELRIQTLLKVPEISKIVVNTDCDEMIKIAKKYRVEIYKREDKYSTDTCSGNELYYCLAKSCKSEIILIAYVISPFINENDYTEAIKLFYDKNVDAVYSMEKIKEFMFYENKPVNFQSNQICRSQELPNYYNATHGIVIVKNKLVLENKNIWFPNCAMYYVDQLKAINIDGNYDFYIAELLFKNKILETADINQKLLLSPKNNFNNMYDLPNNLYLGAVYDAINLMTDKPESYYLNIKPQAGYSKLIHGPVFTISGRNIYPHEDYDEIDKIRYTMYRPELYKNNPIIMLETGNDNNTVAHFGDITCQVYKKLGCQGIVTDGVGRDIDRIKNLNFPVFCREINPIDAFGKWAYVDFQKPISILNKTIYPEDYIFSDSDGVIVIPKNEMETFKSKIQEVINKEDQIREYISTINLEKMDTEVSKFTQENGRF